MTVTLEKPCDPKGINIRKGKPKDPKPPRALADRSKYLPGGTKREKV